jgi:RNA recognition motif-containing protein
VKNLNFSTTEDSLKFHFTNPKINIKSVKIAKNNNLSKGFGFIEFSTNEDV